MAGFKTKKTLKGCSTSMNRLLDVQGTLADIDPDSDNPAPTAALRRCKGLAAVLIVALEDLHHHCHALRQGRDPSRQMSIQDILTGAAAQTGQSDDEGELGEALAGIDEG